MLQIALDWVEKHPGLAGWMQAFGALVSVLIAIWIAHSDNRRRRSEENRQMLGELERLQDLVSGCKTQFDRAKEAIDDPDKAAEYWNTAPDLVLDYYKDKVREVSVDKYPITWGIASLHRIYANLVTTKQKIIDARPLQHHNPMHTHAIANISNEIALYSSQCAAILNAIKPPIKALKRELQPWYRKTQ